MIKFRLKINIEGDFEPKNEKDIKRLIEGIIEDSTYYSVTVDNIEVLGVENE